MWILQESFKNNFIYYLISLILSVDVLYKKSSNIMEKGKKCFGIKITFVLYSYT